MEKMKASIDINAKISHLISQCNNPQIYSNIIGELFVYGIEKPSKVIDSLNILPKLGEKEITNNFNKNINKIITTIKEIISKPSHEMYKVLSCIYGAFLGDATGAFCEFEQPNPNNSKRIFKYPNTVIGGVPGQVTDDSEMALSLAYAIMDNPMKKDLLVDYIYFYYGAWLKTNPLDYGHTTGQALISFDFLNFNPQYYSFNKIEQHIAQMNAKSLSNGFLMRKSTFIAWLYYRYNNEINIAFSGKNVNNNLLQLYNTIKNLSFIDNKCTNPNYQTNVVSAVYSIMALMSIKGFSSEDILNLIINLCKSPNFINYGEHEKFISEVTLYYISLFKHPNFNLFNIFGNLNSKESVFIHMGYYIHAYKLTLYYLYNFNKIQSHSETKYRTIMNQICDLGGDTDTNCCIVGAVIGPLIGMANFGNELIKIIELIPPYRKIYSVALALLLVIYLKKSNEDEKLVQNNKYFLKQILTMLYGDIDLN